MKTASGQVIEAICGPNARPIAGSFINGRGELAVTCKWCFVYYCNGHCNPNPEALMDLNMNKAEIRAFLETRSNAYLKKAISCATSWEWSKEWRQMAYGIRMERQKRSQR